MSSFFFFMIRRPPRSTRTDTLVPYTTLYKKAGVMLLDLHPAAALQVGLFEAPDTPTAQARMRAIDSLNRRFGRDTVTYGTTGTRRAWKLRREFISRRYTTSWDELLVCKEIG